MAELTRSKAQLVHLVIEGLPNHHIADALGIGVRPIERRRVRVFETMAVKTPVGPAYRMGDSPT
jgi:FixJ family two-component response regulator